jgi:Uri superfamily endonuclease
MKSLGEKDVSLKEQDKGTYILLTKLAKPQKIKPGKLPEAYYKKGFYLYVGRARTGLRARIKRHIRRQKKLFWHIDYLLQKAKIVEIWIRQDYFAECHTADKIRDFKPTAAKAIQGFGSSDCRCLSHLFYFPPGTKSLKSLRNEIRFEKVKIYGNNF